MRRERSVVDDPATLRALSFHQPKRLLGAEKRSTQVSLDNALPLVVGHLVNFTLRMPTPALLNSTSNRPNVRSV